MDLKVSVSLSTDITIVKVMKIFCKDVTAVKQLCYGPLFQRMDTLLLHLSRLTELAEVHSRYVFLFTFAKQKYLIASPIHRNNVSFHTSCHAKNQFKSEIQRILPLPARSLDFNAIKNLCDIVSLLFYANGRQFYVYAYFEAQINRFYHVETQITNGRFNTFSLMSDPFILYSPIPALFLPFSEVVVSPEHN